MGSAERVERLRDVIVANAETMCAQVSRLERELADSRRWGNGCEAVIRGLRKEADIAARELKAVSEAHRHLQNNFDFNVGEYRKLQHELATALRERDALRDRPAVSADSSQTVRDQADSWFAVSDQLYRPEKDCTNPDIPASCGCNIAIRMVRKLQRKAAAYDKIIAVIPA